REEIVFAEARRAGHAGGRVGASDLHDLGFFFSGELVDLLDALVDDRLHQLGALLLIVLGDFPRRLILLEHLVGVAARVADGDARVLGHALDDLGQLAAALFGQGRNRNAHDFAVAVGVDAELAIADRFLDRRDQPLLPRLDDDEARVGRRQRRDLIERRRRAVVSDANAG